MSRDILDEFEQQRRGPAYPSVPATPGLLVEDRSSGFCGDVVKVDARAVTLRDRKGATREFVLKPGGFLSEGKPVTLVRPSAAPSASGKQGTSPSSATPLPGCGRTVATTLVMTTDPTT